MFDYIRTWWLINRISKICLKSQAQNRKADRAQRSYFGYGLTIEDFLEDRAKKYWFGFWSLLPQGFRDFRIERDRKLLQRANGLGYTQMATHPDKGLIVTTLPEGDFFAKPTNGAVGFLKEYKTVGIIAVTICVWVWISILHPYISPYARPFICEYLPMSKWCIPNIAK